MYYDIHPKKKQPIGYRLALSARNHLYGENIPCEVPIMHNAEWKDGMLLLHFAHTYDVLTVQDDFNAIQNADLDIAFAWTPYYEVNLYNSAGIPAMPARCTVTNR